MKLDISPNKIQKFKWLVAVLMLINSTGCKKLVEVDGPPTSVSGENVYKTDATAIAVLTSLYAHMSSSSTTNLAFASGVNSISFQAGLSADEFTFWSGALAAQMQAQYKNALSSSVLPPFWNNMYSFLYRVNDAYDGISRSTSLTPAVQKQLLGESRFLRALIFFYLTNMYGDIPLPLKPDYSINTSLPRSSKTLVWQQIITDLKEAEQLMVNGYVDGTLRNNTTERLRPNKWAATALLARTYLYAGENANAEASATAVINQTSVYDTVALNNVFLKNTKEAIWQLQPVFTGFNTQDARVFSLTSAPIGLSAGKPVYLSSFLLNAFEAGDQRKTQWVGTFTSGTNTYYFPNKYKSGAANSPVTEYLMVLRLGEQYLIRAEARAQLNKIAEAQSDLNVIRKRAGLANTTANDKPSLLAAILLERQVELFSEWGHRWFDLKRTGNVDAVMSVATPVKGGTWNSNWQWYPIPLYDLQKDINLIQNSGY